VSDIGSLLPIALRGRTVLYSSRHSSILARAPSRLRNQWVLGHSVMTLPFDGSMMALSVGLPGCELSRSTVFRQAHRSRSRELNSERSSGRAPFG
jgi:hypothetical protein